MGIAVGTVNVEKQQLNCSANTMNIASHLYYGSKRIY